MLNIIIRKLINRTGEVNVNIIYRKAVGDDAKGLLLHLSRVGGETDNLSYDQNTFSISEERERRFIEGFERSKTDVMFVAVLGDDVVGNAIVQRNRTKRYSHRAEISITVVKKYWGQGIGSQLMRMMIDFAKETGIEILYLEVRSDNTRAISLYEKFGFSRIGVYESFFKIGGKYHNADLMTLNLKNLEKISKKS